MAEKTNVPEIRFAGFTDPWEQRKLGELFVESDERSSTEEILSVSVANGIYPASESERDTNPGASIANYKIVRVGDIVYNSMRMWQGAVGSSRYNGIVSPAYVVAKPVVELDSTCFGYLLKRPELLYKYLCNSQGNSKDTQTLRYERFAEITAEVPSTIEEQRAISDCLEGLDNLITLHQRKYDKLAQLKKSMLDKMFPKPGERFPEIRFAGFTDPWEQRKLGELGSVAMCKRIFKEQTTEQGDVPFYKIGTFGGTPDAFISRELFDEYQRLYQFPKVGDILISAAGTIGRTIVYQGDPAYYQDSNIVWLQHDERLDNGFLLQFLNGKSWSSLEGSTLKRLYNKDLLNAEIAIPSPDEQHQIGSTFARLDDIITLHQRKLELLRNTKKSLLDRMFV
ncbi:restriction endonuclease subunit S [Ellagibacter isourolithinifaciens]|uniref:restriction endonuclease subunit S n=1 Tax=Ellagibacter isourolithinifaciens TaxID=2137581 RepID=UPI002E78F7AD|nr:restriction endonuclease subunit S [Ellagibacter isourolithinifaciens]MEE0246191.1 restriction endonuclease subunit S [Ellagibacter isourolithinifaciens]